MKIDRSRFLHADPHERTGQRSERSSCRWPRCTSMASPPGA
jgi:hypothetical protein